MMFARFLLPMLPILAAAGQTFDFEPGEAPWTRSPVFSTQAHEAGQVLTRSIRGSEYGRGLVHALGQHGLYLVATAAGNLGDSATGILTSPEFRIDRQWLSLLIGGSYDPFNECVQLQVRADGEFQTYFSATGGTEALRQATFRVPDPAIGRIARIRIVDSSPLGHINVDYIRFTAGESGPYRRPVWSYADYLTRFFSRWEPLPRHAPRGI